MFNNDLFSDVKFVARNSDGGYKQVIPAHKFVLSIGSPVFEAMFYGELAETRDSIELPDCEFESLLEFFRFMYCDEVNLSGSNVMGVLYLAKKYMVPSLVDKCTEYLQNNLDPSNVFSILPSAQKYDERNLVDRCWEVIDKQTEAAVKSDGFATIERPLLEALVERETLEIAEVKLFKGVVEWATKESKKRGIVADGQEKRRIIGERIVKALRFPVMKQEEFASEVIDSKILTYDEVADVIKYFNSVQSPCVFFPVTKRSSKLIRFRRFDSVKFGWKNSCKTELGIDFKVDRDILFRGVNMFGSMGNNYLVTLRLCVFTGEIYSDVVGGSTTGTFPSVVDVSGTCYCFDVLFKKPLPLKKGVRYCLGASVSGPDSWYGTQGRRTHFYCGVKLSLENCYSFYEDMMTVTMEGQFNELIFSHCK